MIGKRVIVIWTCRAYVQGADWMAFRVLDASHDGLWLEGVNDPAGHKHDGSKVFARHSDIREMIEWK